MANKKKMRSPDKTEIINSLVVILLILISYVDMNNELKRNLLFFTTGLLAFRFMFPLNIHKVFYIDFSKIINIAIWTFIVLLIYYTDKIILSKSFFSISNGLILTIIFGYFILMRSAYYLKYKREPIWYSKFSPVGGYDECVKRKVDKIDKTFTLIYLGILFFGVLVMINI